MSSIFVGAIADDDTGATDLAGMLTAQGMRVVLVLAGATAEQLVAWADGCDAVVIGTSSRSIARQEAYARTRAAISLLQALQPQRLAVKYCSTFDSTAEGNIGASLDALLDSTGERFVVALPALPVLGRTTYMGYHFVQEQLLSDSVMRHHPLNPMTNPHLPSHLQTQTARRVGLVSYRDVAAGCAGVELKLAALAKDGIEIALLDCADDRQLAVLAEAIQSHRVLSGSSAWAMVLPQMWKRSGAWKPADRVDGGITRVRGGSGTLIVSGSCSEATRRQNEWAAAHGVGVIDLDALQIVKTDRLDGTAIQAAVNTLSRRATCVLTTTRAASKRQVQSWADEAGMTPVNVGERIAGALARTAEQVMLRCRPRGLIVAGGETSSTLMRTLNLGGLLIGQNIEPGVPLCASLNQPSLAVVLKSGNFGSEDFYAKAVAAVDGMPMVDSSAEEIHA